MKRSIFYCVVVSVLCLKIASIATAEEWTTPEALRAFGKPGDTVKESTRASKVSTTKSSQSTVRPFKSDSLEALYEREASCKRGIANSSNDIKKTRLEMENVEKDKRRFSNDPSTVAQLNEMLAEIKKTEAIQISGLKELEKMRADNLKEIKARKK